MARVAKASSCAVRTMGKPGESSERCPHPYPMHCHLAVPPLCKGQVSLRPGKSHDRTSKILKTPMKACEQLQFDSDMYSFVRKTSKPPCAFWPIYSRPVCVEKQLELVSRTEIIILDCICSEEDGEDSLIHHLRKSVFPLADVPCTPQQHSQALPPP